MIAEWGDATFEIEWTYLCEDEPDIPDPPEFEFEPRVEVCFRRSTRKAGMHAAIAVTVDSVMSQM